jgi:hypothetical protein
LNAVASSSTTPFAPRAAVAAASADLSESAGNGGARRGLRRGLAQARQGAAMFFKKGRSRSDLISDCLKSDRDPHEEFIDLVYRALLGRSVDPGGLETYAKQIENERNSYCLQRIIRSIAESEEFRRRR